MDIGAVMDDLGAALDTIPGLRVFPYWPGQVHPPAAIVGMPDVTYDLTYQRGVDRISVPVHVVVGWADPRSARDQLLAYTAGDGEFSVKRAVDEHPAGTYADATVQRVEHALMDIGGTSYLAATFTIDIIGSGG